MLSSRSDVVCTHQRVGFITVWGTGFRPSPLSKFSSYAAKRNWIETTNLKSSSHSVVEANDSSLPLRASPTKGFMTPTILSYAPLFSILLPLLIYWFRRKFPVCNLSLVAPWAINAMALSTSGIHFWAVKSILVFNWPPCVVGENDVLIGMWLKVCWNEPVVEKARVTISMWMCVCGWVERDVNMNAKHFEFWMLLLGCWPRLQRGFV